MRIYNIKVNGKKYEVKVMGITEVEPTEVKVVKGEAPVVQKVEAKKEEVKAGPVEGTEVLAPMQGTILDVKCAVNKPCKKGDNLVILEAMKLENEIKAQVDGIVKEVRVSKGQTVNNKDVLVVIG